MMSGQQPDSSADRGLSVWSIFAVVVAAVAVVALIVFLAFGGNDETVDTTVPQAGASTVTSTTLVGTTTSSTRVTTTTMQPTTTTTAGVVEYEWHRVTDQGAHSILSCEWAAAEVECVFDETPAPGGTATVGEFSGEVVDQSMCLDHMVEACATAVSIAQGRQFYDSDGGVDFVIQATIAVQADGTMIHSFDSGRPAAPFYCPWFETLEDANVEDDECTFA